MNTFRNLGAFVLFCGLLAAAVFLSLISSAEAEVSNGSVYAGDGCARAGDVVAGDCKEGRATEGAGVPSSDETTAETTIAEDTSSQAENTTEETSSLESTPVCLVRPDGDVHRATVERVVDGDTLQLAETVAGADRVRMIGVDAPEMESDDAAEPEPGAEEAARFTAETLEGESVLLETDEVLKDDYGRLLAYVWVGAEDGASDNEGLMSNLMRITGMGNANAQPRLFNLKLLEGGYAEVLTIPPNHSYDECLEGAVPTTEQSNAEDQYTDTSESEETILEITESTAADDSPITTQYVENTDATIPETAITVPDETTSFLEVNTPEQTRLQVENETTSREPNETPPGGYSSSELENSMPYQPVPETYAPSGLASESGTLPTVEGPEGPIAVLPDTSGSPWLGFLIVSGGLLSLLSGTCGFLYLASCRVDRG